MKFKMMKTPLSLATYLLGFKPIALVVTCLLINPIISFSQDGESDVLENGPAPLVLQLPKQEVAKYLLSDKPTGDMFITSKGKIDFKKASITSFYGLKVDSIAASFEGVYGEEDELEETLRIVEIYLRLPKNIKAKARFVNALIKHYGPAKLLVTPDGEETIYLQWWNDKAMMNIHLGYETTTGEKVPFYTVTYRPSYGG